MNSFVGLCTRQEWFHLFTCASTWWNMLAFFQSWLYKLPDITPGKRKFRLSSGWKKRYFILLHRADKAYLCYYDKKPKSVEEKPRGIIYVYMTCFILNRMEHCSQSTSLVTLTFYLTAFLVMLLIDHFSQFCLSIVLIPKSHCRLNGNVN